MTVTIQNTPSNYPGPVSMSPFVLRERPLPSSPWLCDDHGCGTTVLDLSALLAHRLPELVPPVTFTGVHLNGVALKFKVMGPACVAVAPRVPRQGDRLDIHGIHSKAPAEPVRPLTSSCSYGPRPTPSYGLTAPENTLPRNAP